VFKDAEVAFAEDRTQLNAASIGKLADAFNKLYAAKFKEDAPATPAALDQERRAVASLSLPAPVRSRLRVVFGAVAGEYIRRHQKGSTWALGAHPVAVNEIVGVETPFGFATNPFQSASLAEMLYRAEGRATVLSDDAACAKEALGKLTDPDLSRGSDLLTQGKVAEADRVLLDMAKRHGGNFALAVQVGTLLHQHQRTKELAELAKPWLDQLDLQGGGLPRDARLYNLIGIAALESGSDKAVLAFQSALRCDLDFGPAYLNLAQAYTKSGSADQVRQCLRRYLKLFPKGEWAEDARRRLAVEGENW
jgi:tetratricopeptide (TPR) repeat protein